MKSATLDQIGQTLTLLGLGALAGTLTAAIIILIRYLIENLFGALLGLSQPGLSSLTATMVVIIPTASALIVGLIFNRSAAADNDTGIAHVLRALGQHAPALPYKNTRLQLVGSLTMLSGGVSGGILGPEIHLAASGSGFFASILRLSTDQIRVLILCTIAVAMATTIQSPLLGVIFALELTLFIPKLSGIVTIMLASYLGSEVYASMLEPIINYPSSEAKPELTELPWAMLVGLSVAMVGFLFTKLVRLFARIGRFRPFWLKAGIAGLSTSLMVLVSPEVMGLGFNTLNTTLAGTLLWSTMVLFLIAKIVAVAACFGMVMPVGIFLPALLMGAACGGLFDIPTATLWLFGEATMSHGGYAFFGMWAMMAVLFRVPLTAIVAAVLLVTNNEALPLGIAVILVAFLTSKYLLHQESLYVKPRMAEL